jgi:7,8-dihydroneopterin aldolase/epimerase/oxygenase
MDIVFISELQVETVIGIYDWERKIKQKVFIDLEMATDIRNAAKEDDISFTLDYKSVGKRIISFVESSEFQLVETLTERIAEIIMSEFNVPWVRIKLNKKGALRGATDVGILIERGER